MENHSTKNVSVSQVSYIIDKAQQVNLDPRVLYEAVIELASEGLITANAINLAAGILLEDLGLPKYFFENLKKESLKHILASIATSMAVKDGKVVLFGRVANIDFSLEQADAVRKVRIATEETRDSMEAMLGEMILGHRREYYYNPKSKYYTYITRPETVNDYNRDDFYESRFLFNLAGDYNVTPEPTRKRYERFLEESESSVTPLIQIFNLPETGETRLMFNSDFETPQVAIFRNLCHDHGFEMIRAYWEPYWGKAPVPSSICSIYIQGELSRKMETALFKDLCAFLSLSINGITELYAKRQISFNEMLFAVNAVDFTHLFIFQERENATDREIIESLTSQDYRDAFAARIHKSNKSTYGSKMILETVKAHPGLIKRLYRVFESRLDPCPDSRITQEQMDEEFKTFRKLIATRFMDFSLGYDIFSFMFKFVSCTLKTNFYKSEKRSFSFRFDNRILDSLVFNQFVYGVFFVNGHYACGTHLRAEDISRGGLRMIRVSRANHGAELDNAVLLNYALGPKAQRLKHKDICESGSKGVLVPHPLYAKGHAMDALYDYTEGIMDLVLGADDIIDYYGRPEMIFFGPDEGTAPLMDAVSFQARQRGYKYWRTITTGKSFGIPHDTYGLLEDGNLFGLFDCGDKGTELQISGESKGATPDTGKIWKAIGGQVVTSGMTTTCVMSAFRTLIDHFGEKEENLNLMVTGGPDGDLGANQIQCYKGKICLIIDGGSILFDADGLDREALMKLAFMRHTSPRVNSLGFPKEKLGPKGFMVPMTAKNVTLFDGTFVEDGALFHRTFLTDTANRKFIKDAHIRAFIPCGGFKDTINQSNVKAFLENFQQLAFIVEGANVFFDDASRRHIATHTPIKQIKDSTANKGGVFSSSIAEVLTAFLFDGDYEDKLLNDNETRWGLIRDIMEMVDTYSHLETKMLIQIHENNPETPLFELSEKTSEQIFALQNRIQAKLDGVIKDQDLVWKTMVHYIPGVLIDKLGRQAIMDVLSGPELSAYRDAIITKKLASMAFYNFGLNWDTYLKSFEKDYIKTLHNAVSCDKYPPNDAQKRIEPVIKRD